MNNNGSKDKDFNNINNRGTFFHHHHHPCHSNLAKISSSPCRKPHKTAIKHQVGEVCWQDICCAMVDEVHGIHQPSKSVGTNIHSALAVLFNQSSGDWVQFIGHTKSLHLTPSIDIGLNFPSNNVFDLLKLQQGPTEKVKEFIHRVKKKLPTLKNNGQGHERPKT